MQLSGFQLFLSAALLLLICCYSEAYSSHHLIPRYAHISHLKQHSRSSLNLFERRHNISAEPNDANESQSHDSVSQSTNETTDQISSQSTDKNNPNNFTDKNSTSGAQPENPSEISSQSVEDSSSSNSTVASTEASPNKPVNVSEKSNGGCEFPSDAGLVAITPKSKNAGWAMSPDQQCSPGSYCPYACPSGEVMSQWNPNAKAYTYPQSMDGGLYCNHQGRIEKPFPEKPYCEPGTGGLTAHNKAGQGVSFCQTVLPGNEAMLIPTHVQEKSDLAVPGEGYWCNTAAHYYINPPGVRTEDACIWGDGSRPVGNWSPYVAGANADSQGQTFVKIGWNPIYTGSSLSQNPPNFGVKITCEAGDCNGTPCSIDPSSHKVGEVLSANKASGAGGANFCVVTVPKGSKANIEVFGNSPGSDDRPQPGPQLGSPPSNPSGDNPKHGDDDAPPSQPFPPNDGNSDQKPKDPEPPPADSEPEAPSDDPQPVNSPSEPIPSPDEPSHDSNNGSSKLPDDMSPIPENSSPDFNPDDDTDSESSNQTSPVSIETSGTPKGDLIDGTEATDEFPPDGRKNELSDNSSNDIPNSDDHVPSHEHTHAHSSKNSAGELFELENGHRGRVEAAGIEHTAASESSNTQQKGKKSVASFTIQGNLNVGCTFGLASIVIFAFTFL